MTFNLKLLAQKAKIIGSNFLSKKELFYIIDKYNWSIKHDGLSITQNISELSSCTSTTHHGIRNSIVHYGSIDFYIKEKLIQRPHKSNKVIVTWFHIRPDKKQVKLINKAIQHIDIWHTSCSKTGDALITYGIPNEKLCIIPLGIDLNVFYPCNLSEKKKIRKELNIPENIFVIGSFQKDGNGWESGSVPKLIKGPDIFCDAIEKIAQSLPVFILLTGPARGYVKNRLKKADIPYRHIYLSDCNLVAKYYRALDLYIVSSREEGGPKAILESLASGVPLISTKVGMAIDMIKHNQNGILVDIEDSNEIARQSINLLECPKKKQHIIANGLETIKSFDWQIIAKRYYDEIYKKVL